MSPVAGIVAHRVKQWGKQAAFGTAVAATERVGLGGVPTVNPGWTNPEGAMTGSIDPVMAPFRTAMDVSSPFEGQLYYDLIPRIMGGLKGGVSPTPGKTATIVTSLAADDIVDTSAPHTFLAGEPVIFTTITGGTGLLARTIYYVIAANLAATTLQIALVAGGTAINFTTDITAGTLVRADNTWTHAFASLTQDTFDYLTEQFGDDDTADYMQLYDGIVEEVTFELPADMGPWTCSGTLRFSNANQPGSFVGAVPTTGLSVPTNPQWVYGGHTGIWINDTAGAIGTTQLTDALHGLSIHIAPAIGQKRYANASGFGLGAFARESREITMEARFAKTAAVRAEVVKWIASTSQNRYIEVKNTSPDFITAAIPWSWSQRFGGRWYTREDAEEGGNSAIVLGCTAFYDTTLAYPYRSSVVTNLAL